MKLKRPSDSELARQALGEMDDQEIAMILFECIGLRKDVIDHIIENFDDTVHDLAEDEWDAICEYEERARDTHLSPSGGYWI